jgi:hypothetical protein
LQHSLVTLKSLHVVGNCLYKQNNLHWFSSLLNSKSFPVNLFQDFNSNQITNYSIILWHFLEPLWCLISRLECWNNYYIFWIFLFCLWVSDKDIPNQRQESISMKLDCCLVSLIEVYNPHSHHLIQQSLSYSFIGIKSLNLTPRATYIKLLSPFNNHYTTKSHSLLGFPL